jgi:hypothetical protein
LVHCETTVQLALQEPGTVVVVVGGAVVVARVVVVVGAVPLG